MKIEITKEYEILPDRDNLKYCSYQGKSGYYGEYYFVAKNCEMLNSELKYCRLFDKELKHSKERFRRCKDCLNSEIIKES